MREIIWTSSDAARATGGIVHADWQASGVSIDTRTLKEGDLFVALVGERDGHDYVKEALDKGAAAAMVSRVPNEVTDKAKLLEVTDTQNALEKLGQYARKRTEAKVIGITGSVGKTSTKEMVKAALSTQGEVYATEGNLNNHIGVPLSLARLPQNVDYGIFEMGMNHAGEIAALSKQVQPDIAIITTVEPVHIEFFENVEAIADAKAEIFAGMGKKGVAILNKDIPHFERLSRAAKHAGISKIFSFGKNETATFSLLACTAEEDRSRITVRCPESSLTYQLSLAGEHQACNSAAALAVVAALEGNLDAALHGMSELMPGRGRGAEYVVKLPQGVCLLIDDTYNASPASIVAALKVLDDRRILMKGRAIAILGDMFELGDQATRLHEQLKEPIESLSIDLVHVAGEHMQSLYNSLPEEKRGFQAKDVQSLIDKILPEIKSGDAVLVKGSRGMKMEQFVDALLAQGKIAAAPDNGVKHAV